MSKNPTPYVGPGAYEVQENSMTDNAIKILNSENLKHYVKLNVN